MTSPFISCTDAVPRSSIPLQYAKRHRADFAPAFGAFAGPTIIVTHEVTWSSVCYALVHGGKQYRSALEQYLGLINRTTPPAKAFGTVFGQNVDTFQKAWEKGLDRMEPDPWFTSVHHLQLMAIALKALHAQHLGVQA